MRAVPLQPCRRHGKKRKEDEPDAVINKHHKEVVRGPGMHIDVGLLDSMDAAQLQNPQVSSTVLDSPVSMYQGWGQDGYHPDPYWSRGWNTDCKNPGAWWGDPLAEMKADADSTTGLMRYAAQYSPSNPSPCPSTPQSAPGGFVFPSAASSWQQTGFTQSAPSTPLANIPWQNENTPSKKIDPVAEEAAARASFAGECLKAERLQRPPSTSWDYTSPPATPQTPASPFRVPKARPPSRTHSNASTESPATPTTPTYCKGFLKPFPPGEPRMSAPSAPGWPSEVPDWHGKQEPGHSAWTDNQSYPAASYAATAAAHNPFAYGYPSNSAAFLGWGNEAPGAGYYCHPQQLASPFMYHQQSYHPFYHASHHPFFPMHAEPPMPRSEPIGKVTEICDNEECFKDSQMGGVAIALSHGAVLFECAKQELHSTTALRRPNRLRPSRISLVFYQHRNLNRARHGWDEWEEKMRLRKLGITVAGGAQAGAGGTTTPATAGGVENGLSPNDLMMLDKPKSLSTQFGMRATATCTTNTVTTLFPMHPCVVTGPYQENGTGD